MLNQQGIQSPETRSRAVIETRDHRLDLIDIQLVPFILYADVHVSACSSNLTMPVGVFYQLDMSMRRIAACLGSAACLWNASSSHTQYSQRCGNLVIPVVLAQ
ncbi:hypothetical protein DTO169C6_2269 [Paecilomyces variotii]|nr:hypothetical protein DTO169C6_2269 [Paecilomyces variotii]